MLEARSINSVIEGAVGEEAAFGVFEARHRREFGVFYEFLVSFYEMHVAKESYFWAARKVTNSSHSEMQAFVDLVGGVSSGKFDPKDAESVARRFSAESKEFGRAINQRLAGGENDRVVPMFKSAIVREAMKESAQLQARAQLGAEFRSETPIFPGGLISSDDGLLWIYPCSTAGPPQLNHLG